MDFINGFFRLSSLNIWNTIVERVILAYYRRFSSFSMLNEKDKEQGFEDIFCDNILITQMTSEFMRKFIIF